VLWYVSLRWAAPAIGVAAVWISTVVMTEISVTDFFQVRTFAEEVYTQAALGMGISIAPPPPDRADNAMLGASDSSSLGMWSGIALTCALAVVMLAAIVRLLADLTDSPHRPPWIWRLKSARWPATLVLVAIMLLVAGVPLGNLLYKGGIDVLANEEGRIRLWTLRKLIERLAAAPHDFAGELWLSIRIGVLAATAAVVVAVPLAWSLRGAISRSGGGGWALRRRWVGLLGVALCLTIPGPLLGLGVIRILNQSPDSPLSSLARLYDSNFAPWLVQVVRALPIATLIMWPALASVPQVQLDTAAIDGCGWWGQLLRIALPQRWRAVAAAWLIALAVAVGELAATVLVMPPQVGATALSIKIFQDLHFGVDYRVAAICLVMVAGIAALTGIAGLLVKRKDR
jgi:ABC-type Fe3+ transport system permease subunit